MRSQHLPLPLLLFALLPPSALGLEAHEKTPVVLSASKLLPGEIVQGPHHRVNDRVENDGYMNHYKIASDFGGFEARDTAQLMVRLKEIEAIAQLKEISRTDAFAEAAKRSAIDDVEAAAEFAKHPVETAKGVPDGISRLAKRTARKANNLKDDASEHYDDYKQTRAEKKARRESDEAGEVTSGEEWSSTLEDAREVAAKGGEIAGEVAKDYLGYSGARRYWAKRLGVDPYTDNEVLNQQLNRVAQAAAAGGFTMKFVPIPSLGLLNYMGDVDDLVWDLDPLDLRMRNERLLYERGYSKEGAERLCDNRAQTPSLITVLVDSLVALDGVEGRVTILDKAATTKSRDVARFLARTTRFFASYHQNVRPLKKIVDVGVVPSGVAEDGRIVVALAVDHLSWTKAVAELYGKHAERLAALGIRGGEVWLEGGCSGRTRTELEANGFTIETDSFDNWR